MGKKAKPPRKNCLQQMTIAPMPETLMAQAEKQSPAKELPSTNDKRTHA
ncbi:hypothetical protein [Pantoea sp. ACRSB]|nr:hypothetical protein [Pantoea sp. ACRSB]MCG7390037.1 hypothetical protein [Pantoea sp. ACRSB]